MLNILPAKFRLLLLLPALALGGCAAFEGVNVGANIPLGGIVNVGANKTIGQSQPSAPKRRAPTQTESEDEAELEEEQNQETE